jgi:hypothetical protein
MLLSKEVIKTGFDKPLSVAGDIYASYNKRLKPSITVEAWNPETTTSVVLHLDRDKQGPSR